MEQHCPTHANFHPACPGCIEANRAATKAATTDKPAGGVDDVPVVNVEPEHEEHTELIEEQKNAKDESSKTDA